MDSAYRRSIEKAHIVHFFFVWENSGKDTIWVICITMLKHLLMAIVVLLTMMAPSMAQEAKKGSYTPADTPPASAQQVAIGFYPVSVYQLDMASNTYYVDTYVWMRWTGEIDPTGTIEFVGREESGSF